MPEQPNVQLVDANGVINPLTGGTGTPVDGVVVGTGVWVLLPNPPNGLAYAGVYESASGAWTRVSHYNEASEMELGDWWYVVDGNEYHGTTWHLDGDSTPTTIDVDPITISQRTRRRPLEEGSGISIEGTTPPVVSWVDPTEVESTFIEGLNIEYVSASSIRVTAGAAYIPQSGTANITTDTTLSGLTLTANTWYYLYAYDAGGGVLGIDPPDLQAPTTTPYRGTARAKGPDGTPNYLRRYIGAIYASATNTVRRFQRLPGDFTKWVIDQDGALRVVDRSSTTATVVQTSVLTHCPPTAEAIYVVGFISNVTNNLAVLYISDADDGLIGAAGTTNPSAGQVAIGPTNTSVAGRMMGPGIIALGSTKAIREAQSLAGASQTVDVLGYYESR